MIEFGKTLREAREAKGLTTGQIAESTHMMVQMVESLEHEDFTRIAAPIYGRGFVRLYCEAVGLDPKPMVEEFMEIYSGNRAPVIRTRPVQGSSAPVPAPAAEPAPATEPEPAAEPEPAPEPAAEPSAAIPPPPADDTLFTFASRPVAPPPPPPPPPSPATFTAPAAAQPAATPEDTTRRIRSPYAAPFYRELKDRFAFSIPPALWRILVLVAAAALILWLLFIGVRALYRATMSEPVPTPEIVETVETPAAKPDKPAEPAAPRERLDIPALYID